MNNIPDMDPKRVGESGNGVLGKCDCCGRPATVVRASAIAGAIRGCDRHDPPCDPREEADSEDEHAIAEGLLDTAWGIIANVSGGNWKQQNKVWQQAAARWRNAWLRHISKGD